MRAPARCSFLVLWVFVSHSCRFIEVYSWGVLQNSGAPACTVQEKVLEGPASAYPSPIRVASKRHLW